MPSAVRDVFSPKLFNGLSVFLAYTLMDPLIEDLQDTFGKSFLYHPFTLWLCITLLVYTQTDSLTVGIVICVIYEAFKALWRLVTPEPPRVGQLRKLLHRVQNGEKLSDRDLEFLNKVTPEDVKVTRR